MLKKNVCIEQTTNNRNQFSCRRRAVGQVCVCVCLIVYVLYERSVVHIIATLWKSKLNQPIEVVLSSAKLDGLESI